MRKDILVVTHEPITKEFGIVAGEMCRINAISVNEIVANENALRGHKYTTILIPEELKKPSMEVIYEKIRIAVTLTIIHHGGNFNERIVTY